MTFDPLVIPFADSGKPARRWSFAAFQVVLLRLAMVGLFTAMLAATDTYAWQHTGIFLALLAVFPSLRRVLLVAAGLLFAYLMPPVNHWLIAQLATDHGSASEWVSIWPAGVAIALLFGIVLCAAFRRYPRSIVARRPLLTLLAVLLSLLLAVS